MPEDAAGRAASGAKVMTVIGAVLAGADSIDGIAMLRADTAAEVFDDTRALWKVLVSPPRFPGLGASIRPSAVQIGWVQATGRTRAPVPDRWRRRSLFQRPTGVVET